MLTSGALAARPGAWASQGLVPMRIRALSPSTVVLPIERQRARSWTLPGERGDRRNCTRSEARTPRAIMGDHGVRQRCHVGKICRGGRSRAYPIDHQQACCAGAAWVAAISSVRS